MRIGIHSGVLIWFLTLESFKVILLLIGGFKLVTAICIRNKSLILIRIYISMSLVDVVGTFMSFLIMCRKYGLSASLLMLLTFRIDLRCILFLTNVTRGWRDYSESLNYYLWLSYLFFLRWPDILRTQSNSQVATHCISTRSVTYPTLLDTYSSIAPLAP